MMLRALREFAPRIFERTHWLIAANASEEVMSADFGRRVAERCPDGAKAVLVFEGGWTISVFDNSESQFVDFRNLPL